MEAKPTSANKNLTRYIAIGGIGLAIFGASYFISRSLKRKGKQLPKELVLKLLHQIKKELFPVWNLIAGEVTDYLILYQLRNVPQDFKRDALARGQSYFFI